jgi:hypothetical protein
MNPSPNAAPISPKFRARRSGGLMSAMYARAVVMLPPVNPSRRRERNSHSRFGASASITKLAADPNRLKISTGRRPHRSDQSPRIGEATNCAIENDANSSPICSSLAWNCWA